MEKDEDNQFFQDCLPNITEDNIKDFVSYQKKITQDYKSRAQKNKERVQKLTKHVWDLQTKKQKRQEQKAAAKIKLHEQIDKMSKQEARQYLDEKKEKKKREKEKIRQAMKTGRVIMLDLMYETKMNAKENASLGKQIQLVMRAIKQAEQPPSIHLCSFGGKAEEQLKKMEYQHWAVTTHKEDVLQVGKMFNKKLIYLSPDAPDKLQTILPDDIFILGGLIDRTVLKEASLSRARELGLEARRLPINEFMKGRLCLNLDHVVSMICKFAETNDWKTAFDYAAPKRWKKESFNKSQKQEEQFKQEVCQKKEERQVQDMRIKGQKQSGQQIV